jgi:hypothetical protein
LRIEGVAWSAQQIPAAVNLSFQDRSRYFFIQELQWDLLEDPPYSPDLAASDFHLFGPLKETLMADVLLMI